MTIKEVMALKQGQETHNSYMDGVRVKISENYKPPPRITSIITYTQRILQNKSIQDNIPQYDFSLEITVKEKMKELKTARQQLRKEKRERLEKAKEEWQKKEEKANLERLNSNENVLFSSVNNAELNSKYQEKFSQTYQSSDSINTFNHIPQTHYPIQPVSSPYSAILTPTPLKEPISTIAACKLNDKSPLNISEFEANNSSPFDNVELKSINDYEELKQVLKNNVSVSRSTIPTYTPSQMPQYSNYTPISIPNMSEPSTSYVTPNYSNFNSQPTFTTSSSSEMLYQQKLTNNLYSTANGYYYPSVSCSYDYEKVCSYTIPQTASYSYCRSDVAPPISTQASSISMSYKSVPDIMKALQNELDNVHVSNTTVNRTSCPESAMHSVKSESYKRKREVIEDNKDNPFHLLPKNLQVLTEKISSMGFPLPRVARICQLIGDDQKKVIEHLLAMSDLLDLGFSESDVSKALLKSDNDRDKALDILIS